ncbi:MAG: CBS domain-containing protein, partial [Campylobacterota bacterium]
MYYPKLIEIATKDVITVNTKDTVAKAVSLMDRYNIRDIIVTAEGEFFILTATYLLQLELENISFSTPLKQLPLHKAVVVDEQATVLEGLKAIQNEDGYICIAKENDLLGIVSYSDLSRSLDPSLLAKTQTIEQLLHDTDPVFASRDETLKTLMPKLAQNRQRCAIIDHEGIITQKDVIKALKNGHDHNLSVTEIMTYPMFSISAKLNISEALKIAQEKKYKRLVVKAENGRILGVVSQKDLINIYYNQWYELLKQHQQELQEQNTQLELIADEMPRGMIVLDTKGRIARINEKTTQLLGYSQEELLGKEALHVFECAAYDNDSNTLYCHKETGYVQPTQCGVFTMLAQNRPFEMQEHFITKEGRVMPVEISAKPLGNSIGDMHAILLFDDITKRLQKQKALKMERDMLIGGPELLFIWENRDGWPVSYVSPNVKTILGYSKEEVLESGFKFIDIIHPKDKPQAAEEVAQYVGEGKTQWEQFYRVKTKKGQYLWFYDFTVPQYGPNGEIENFRGYLLDQTQKVELELELKRINENLVSEIQSQSTQLSQKQDMLIAQGKLAAMGEMIGAITHQWRQPLNALNISIQNLDDDYEDGLIDRAFIEDFIARQLKTIRFMNQTIDDFKNFFKQDSQKSDFSVLQVVQNVQNILGAQMKNNNITLELTGEDFTLHGHESHLQQVMMNLINNSKDAIISRGREEGVITVSLDGGKSVCTVCDNGGGVEEAVLKRMFEPYFTTKDAAKGTGIGLHISKTIIEEHFGSTIQG